MTMVYRLVLSLGGAVAMGRRELEQCQLRRGGTGHRGEEVTTFDDGSMIYNGSRLEIGLWWLFFVTVAQSCNRLGFVLYFST